MSLIINYRLNEKVGAYAYDSVYGNNRLTLSGTLWQTDIIPKQQYVYPPSYLSMPWKNFYAVSDRDSGTAGVANQLQYAKQMGYDFIAVKSLLLSSYQNNPNVAGLRFYVVDPRNCRVSFSGLSQDSYNNAMYIYPNTTYSTADKDWYEQRMVWVTNDTFPGNIGCGWVNNTNGAAGVVSVRWDLQQQAVIDELIEKHIAQFKSFEDKTRGFTFAGYMIDVPKLYGEFNYWNGSTSVATTIRHWTGTDSGLLHGSITHEYPTYNDGVAAYYKQLNARMRLEFPDAKWIIEPYWIYHTISPYTTGNPDEWVNQVHARTDKDELIPDMLTQESSSTDFVDDTNIFNSGLAITKDMVGITQPNSVGEYDNRLYAAKAGINGAWYNWFLRYGGTTSMPDFQSIVDVYPRLKLIRCVPSWDNMNNVPLTDRSWDGSVYQSTKSYIDSNVIYSRHYKTGKLFAVFITTSGVIKLNDYEIVTSVQSTDGYFVESGDASADFDITGNEIRLKTSVSIDVDASNGEVKGRGYIFTIAFDNNIGRPCLYFPTITSRSTVADSSLLNFERTDSFSGMAWIKCVSGSISRIIVGKLTTGLASRGWVLFVATTGRLTVYLTNTSSSNQINRYANVGRVDDGVWRHVCFTYNGSSSAAGLLFYINGVAVTNGTTTDNLTATIINSNPVSIGNAATVGYNYGFFGNIADVRIYNETLSPSAISAIYTQTLTVRDTLVAIDNSGQGTDNNLLTNILEI